ncbi:MAG: ACP S-malonyltransferase [Rickettsiales bacterium]|jgi:[acyl-carrier-protein] S-malonyltransferase|nr:ACP S-malonyltransferase [Rickettsiales bacterium]
MKKSFIFPGQGSQTVGMLKDFYDNFAAAKQMFEMANDFLGKDIKTLMFDGPEEVLTRTENAQPAIMLGSAVTLEILKGETGKTIDELCDFTAGHSLGEYSALCAAGVLNLEDSLKLLKIRGEAFAEAGKSNPGSMVALIGASIEQSEDVANKARLNGEILQVANDNTAGQTVLSGNKNSIAKAIDVAKEMGIKKVVPLPVSGAFHSELMRPATAIMSEALGRATFSEPLVRVMANYTADAEEFGEIKNNLIKQITARVRWRETMLNMEKYGSEMFVELGNGKVLSGMVGRTCPNVKSFSINSPDALKEFINLINNEEKPC